MRQEAIEKHVSCGHRCSEPCQTGARTSFKKCRCSTETNILISSGPATVFTLARCYVASVQTEKKTEVLHTEIKVQPRHIMLTFLFLFNQQCQTVFPRLLSSAEVKWRKTKEPILKHLWLYTTIFKQPICCERNVTCL